MLPETESLLDEFYKPFNEELAELMDDSRFLFERIPPPSTQKVDENLEKIAKTEKPKVRKDTETQSDSKKEIGSKTEEKTDKITENHRSTDSNKNDKNT